MKMCGYGTFNGDASKDQRMSATDFGIETPSKQRQFLLLCSQVLLLVQLSSLQATFGYREMHLKHLLLSTTCMNNPLSLQLSS